MTAMQQKSPTLQRGRRAATLTEAARIVQAAMGINSAVDRCAIVARKKTALPGHPVLDWPH